MSAYVGRLIDLLITNVPSTEDGVDTLLVTDFGTTGKVCTGIQKAAQQWHIHFLTERGSVKSDPTYGTEFLPLCRGKNLSEATVIKSVFVTAESQLQRWSKLNVDLDVMPDDEVISQATLLSFSFSNGTLTLRVLLTTRAGTSRTFIAPISSVTIGK